MGECGPATLLAGQKALNVVCVSFGLRPVEVAKSPGLAGRREVKCTQKYRNKNFAGQSRMEANGRGRGGDYDEDMRTHTL